jgi:hypothetical protein
VRQDDGVGDGPGGYPSGQCRRVPTIPQAPIITVFSARLYGSRSHKNRAMIEALKTAAKEVSPL